MMLHLQCGRKSAPQRPEPLVTSDLYKCILTSKKKLINHEFVRLQKLNHSLERCELILTTVPLKWVGVLYQLEQLDIFWHT